MSIASFIVLRFTPNVSKLEVYNGIRVAKDVPGDMRGPHAGSGPEGSGGPDSYREHTNNKQTLPFI